MIRYILILLMNVIGIFGANANYCAEHVFNISQCNDQDNSGGKIESAPMTIASFGIIEGNNTLVNHFAAGNKFHHHDNYTQNRHVKMDLTSDNINLLTFIRKDIHFLSVLLI